MKTLLICLILLLALSGSATPSEKVKCPIMKDRVIDKAEALRKKLYVDYKGKRYFVCCKTCVTLFKRNPAKYADGTGEPLPVSR